MADISITPTAVFKGANGSPSSNTIAAGVTITQGQAVVKLLDNTLALADSNGTTPALFAYGIALTAGSPGQPCSWVGTDSAFTTGGTLTSGTVIYASNTAGGLTSTYSDLASGSTVVVMGVTNTNGTLLLNPQIGGVK